MPDTTIDCIDCNAPFTFTETEAQFYAEKALSRPKRCQSCRTKRRRDREGIASPTFTDTTCTNCGEKCSVPFVPREGKPVYCQSCFKNNQSSRV